MLRCRTPSSIRAMMPLFVALLLSTVFLSRALQLTCNVCPARSCYPPTLTCSSPCGATTTSVYTDLPAQPLNGRKCFVCNGTDCSRTLACEGAETHCFTATVQGIGGQTLAKGCSSRRLCGINGTQALVLPARSPALGNFSRCCEGNLCNAAHSWRAHAWSVVALSFIFSPEPPSIPV
ncbi:hypothetical protein DNTS_021618 [Danionella cerebrum]|uniref:Snake toxin/toxin-like domain-containing protein n=1 Tax=Danionella cerebrum TaxID=2873325 RepID=A0A553QXQ1_9TELE|nr:hypothetical protein DNTS_021618 [Danionella translucida]